MNAHPLRIALRHRRLVVIVTLVAMVFLLVGIPMPSMRTGKKSGSPFPCQDCACHCDHAAQCWDQCCCHTDEEKLQWAADHGVQAPDFLVARVTKARVFASTVANSNQPDATGAKRSCCSKTATSSLDAPTSSRCASVVREKNSSCHLPAVTSQTDPSSKVRVIVWDAVRKCKGIELALKLMSHSMPIVGRATEERATFLLFFLALADDNACSAISAVDPPVPWVTAS